VSQGLEIFDRDVIRRAYLFIAKTHGYDILRGGRRGRYYLVPRDASFPEISAIMERGDGYRTMEEAADASGAIT
jgi:hypothetical protein